jgi:hypothetical protein
MMMARGLRGTAVLLIVLAVWPVTAAESPDRRSKPIYDRRWIASSTTSMGITGDVRLTATSITFDQRVTFQLRYLSEVAAADPDDGASDIRQFSLFEIVDPRPRAIHNGNHLCGHPRYAKSVPLPRYLAVGVGATRWSEDDYLLILAFKTDTPPEIKHSTEGYCGGFGYYGETNAPNPKPQKRQGT